MIENLLIFRKKPSPDLDQTRSVIFSNNNEQIERVPACPQADFQRYDFLNAEETIFLVFLDYLLKK